MYMQGNITAKCRLQQHATRIQNNSKSFRRNILISVKLESLRRNLTFFDDLLAQTYTNLFLIRIHFNLPAEREVLYVKVKVSCVS